MPSPRFIDAKGKGVSLDRLQHVDGKPDQMDCEGADARWRADCLMRRMLRATATPYYPAFS
jgi:hypothetical protein